MTPPETCAKSIYRDRFHSTPCGRPMPCGIHSDEAKKKRRAKSDAAYALKQTREDVGTLRRAAMLLRRRNLESLADRVTEAAARWKQELEDGRP